MANVAHYLSTDLTTRKASLAANDVNSLFKPISLPHNCRRILQALKHCSVRWTSTHCFYAYSARRHGCCFGYSHCGRQVVKLPPPGVNNAHSNQCVQPPGHVGSALSLATSMLATTPMRSCSFSARATSIIPLRVASRPDLGGKFEIEAADDFVLTAAKPGSPAQRLRAY